MQLDFDPEQSKAFIATALARKLLTAEQAESLEQAVAARNATEPNGTDPLV